MRYFDMHCDTLSRCADAGEKVEENPFDLDVQRLTCFSTCVQVFAAFIHDDYKAQAAKERFDQLERLYRQTDFSGITPVLSIENLSCLNGDVDAVYRMKEKGVQIASLVWNGDNGIAGGVDGNSGITPFGKEVVHALEETGIVIDVSHLNEKSFYDLEKVATKPFVATHSNVKSICGHKRNLTDDQIRVIFEHGGVVGLNFYSLFLGKRRREYDDVLRHIEHFLQLCGEDHIGLGTDFDGADFDERFSGVQKMPLFYEYLTKKLSRTLADKIFFENCNDFFKIILTNN